MKNSIKLTNYNISDVIEFLNQFKVVFVAHKGYIDILIGKQRNIVFENDTIQINNDTLTPLITIISGSE